MSWNSLLSIPAYIIAAALAYTLHEAAHYVVHARYAESVEIGIGRHAPYVDPTYSPGSGVLAARIGSMAPTIVYSPLISLGVYLYRTHYPIPDLSLTGWMMVVVPLLILVYPTASDRHGYFYGPSQARAELE